MARFYAEIQGNRGRATRMGTPKSGISSHTRGWNIGVHVFCGVGLDGKDYIIVEQTGGSNNPKRFKRLATLKED